MSWWSELKYFIRKFNQRHAEQELEEEISTHLELETREKIEAGLSPEEARYAARRAFGSVTLRREKRRGIWGAAKIESLCQDRGYGVAILFKKHGFTLCTVSNRAHGLWTAPR